MAGVKTLEPGGLDVVFECCGEQEALDQAIEMLKPGGKLLLIGIPPTAAGERLRRQCPLGLQPRTSEPRELFRAASGFCLRTRC